LVQATAAELAFFVAEKTDPIVGGDHFFPIDVIEFEGETFDVVFNVTPKNRLDALVFPGEQTEFQFAIDILGNHLGIFADLEQDRFAIANDRHRVIALAGQFPDQGTVSIGDIGDFEGGP
jgi:hypothetical protein